MRRVLAALTIAGCSILVGCGAEAETQATSTSAPSVIPSQSASETRASPTATQTSRFPSDQLPPSEVEAHFVAFVKEQGYLPKAKTERGVNGGRKLTP
jgi:hypothetical protein